VFGRDKSIRREPEKEEALFFCAYFKSVNLEESASAGIGILYGIRRASEWGHLPHGLYPLSFKRVAVLVRLRGASCAKQWSGEESGTFRVAGSLFLGVHCLG